MPSAYTMLHVDLFSLKKVEKILLIQKIVLLKKEN